MTSAERIAPSPSVRWTSRQKEVLDLIACGYTNAEIAERLGVSLGGAKWHVSEVMTILGASNREEAADYWRRERSFSRRLAGMFGLLAVPAKALAIGAGILVAGIAAVLVAIVALSDSTSSTPATVPTPEPPTSTLAVYTRSIDTVTESGRDWDLREVVVHDLATGDEAKWQYSEVGAYPVAASLAGNFVFTATEQEIVRWHLDGSGRTSVFSLDDEGLAIADISASPGGAILAATVYCFACESDLADGVVVLFDVASGSEVARVSKETDFPGFAGWPSMLHWRDDDSGVLVTGATHSEALGGVMTVWLDGTVQVYDLVGGLPSPDAKMLVIDEGDGEGCPANGGSLEVRDLDTGQTVVAYTEGDNYYTQIPLRWNPDGSSILTQERNCVWTTTVLWDWRLGFGDSGSFVPVDRTTGQPSEQRLLTEWYGPSRIEAQCVTRVRIASAEEYEHFVCPGVSQMTDLTIAGISVGSGTDVEYLGLTGPPLTIE